MPHTLDDLLEVAIEHEVSTQQLYRDALAVVRDEQARRFLGELVAEEELHEKTLREMRDEGLYDGETPVVDEALFAGSRMSHSARGELTPESSVAQVLELALAREHRAQLIFQLLARTAREPELSQLFDRLATEEQFHHQEIERRFLRLTGQMGDEG